MPLWPCSFPRKDYLWVSIIMFWLSTNCPMPSFSPNKVMSLPFTCTRARNVLQW